MGNQQFQLILVLIIFLVSLLSSVDVIRGSGRTKFLKYSREQQPQNVVKTAVEPPPAAPAPAQPLFYQQSKKDNNPYGLNRVDEYTPPPPPHTHHYTHNTPPPPPPPPHTPPPPHHHGFGFPNNYDPNYYVTHADNTAEKPTIIEDEKKELQANKYDFLDEDEDEDEDEEDEKFQDLDNFDPKAPPPPSPHGPASRYVYNPTFTTTKTDHNYKTKYAPTRVGPPPLQRGMSDTNFMENGKWAYDLGTETFTSTEHPFNQVANQQNTIEANEDPFNDEP